MDKDTRDLLKQEALKRAEEFEFMSMSQGWSNILARFQNEIQAFTNGLLTSTGPIADFESKRHEIIGMRKLIGWVSSDLDMLKEHRKKDETRTTE